MLDHASRIAEGDTRGGMDAWPVADEPDRPRRPGPPLPRPRSRRRVGISPACIHLAIGHPALPGRLLLAILTDEEYLSEPRRVRDRPPPLARPELALHRLIHGLFIDPEKEITQSSTPSSTPSTNQRRSDTRRRRACTR